MGNAIVLGSHKIPMVTTNALNYREKKLPEDQQHGSAKPSLQQTSALVLGDDRCREPMETINQHYFTAKSIEPNKLP